MERKLSPAQVRALDLLRAGGLDYRREVFGFAAPGAIRADRVDMATAQALIRAGLAVATRTKPLRGREVPDRIELA